MREQGTWPEILEIYQKDPLEKNGGEENVSMVITNDQLACHSSKMRSNNDERWQWWRYAVEVIEEQLH